MDVGYELDHVAKQAAAEVPMSFVTGMRRECAVAADNVPKFPTSRTARRDLAQLDSMPSTPNGRRPLVLVWRTVARRPVPSDSAQARPGGHRRYRRPGCAGVRRTGR